MQEEPKKIKKAVVPKVLKPEEKKPTKLVKFWRHGGGVAILLPIAHLLALGWPKDAELWVVADVPRKRLIVEKFNKGGGS